MANRSILIFLLAALPFAASACQYTVRDVGFVDLRERAYTLYILPDSTSLGLWEEFASATGRAFFAETNIRMEVLPEEGWRDHTDLKPLADRIGALPRSVLVSEEGRALLLDNPIQENSSRSEILAYLEGFLDSPLRGEITRLLVRSHCITLLVEGGDEEENRNLARVIDGVHDNLSKRLGQLPKAAKEGPKLLTLGHEALDRERVLLWSLGLESDAGSTPSVAVLFGKGRALGGALTAEEATLEEIERRVGLIGESCECELDRSWMQGESIPLRWDFELQTEVAKTLGFDAENPMVKMEIAQILDKGAGTGPAAESFAFSEDPLFGYGEMEVIDFDSPPGDLVAAEREVRVTRIVSAPSEPSELSRGSQETAATVSTESLPESANLEVPSVEKPKQIAQIALEPGNEFQAPSWGSLGRVAAALFFTGTAVVGLAVLLLPRSGRSVR